MSAESDRRAEEFLKISHQFQLGHLVTESFHPVTADLSETAKADTVAGLRRLFEVDEDVVRTYKAFVESGRAKEISATLVEALMAGGNLFFTGCGSTGRLSIQLVSIWRHFWQRQRARGLTLSPSALNWENRAFAAMAGGDFALIKSVEGFEDYTQFGRKQMADYGVGPGDVTFAITEGGETSFVIGTAWEALDKGAKVYFVYNNPDDVLSARVERSRQIIEEPRIEKINLTTAQMGISGSTRMQATTIQQVVLVTILEMTLREIFRRLEPGGPCALDPDAVPGEFLAKLEEMLAILKSDAVCNKLAKLVEMEAKVYRSGKRNNYFAHGLGIDVFTDTTERSPTFCTPPFRRWDDTTAAESWSFLFVPYEDTPKAWEHILKRTPRCIEWTDEEVREMLPSDEADKIIKIVRRIGREDLMKLLIGLDGLEHRPPRPGDSAVAIVAPSEHHAFNTNGAFYRLHLEEARQAGASTGAILFGPEKTVKESAVIASAWNEDAVIVPVPVPQTDFLLNGILRAGVKMLLNAMSTCTMVLLGRVMGNTMIYVVPSNLKLIDRATRYISRLTGLEYKEALYLLHEVMEYVEPRMAADQTYPPVVGLAVIRAREGLSNEEAEKRFWEEIGT
jgi:N-acetylmuramic acid 6-phosphate etherase